MDGDRKEVRELTSAAATVFAAVGAAALALAALRLMKLARDIAAETIQEQGAELSSALGRRHRCKRKQKD